MGVTVGVTVDVTVSVTVGVTVACNGGRNGGCNGGCDGVRKGGHGRHVTERYVNGQQFQVVSLLYTGTAVRGTQGWGCRWSLCYYTVSFFGRHQAKVPPECSPAKAESHLNLTDRGAMPTMFEECPHGRVRYLCKSCGGNGVCHHNRQKSLCVQCMGGSICQHRKRKTMCIECGGGGLCAHGVPRTRCKVCERPNPWKMTELKPPRAKGLVASVEPPVPAGSVKLQPRAPGVRARATSWSLIDLSKPPSRVKLEVGNTVSNCGSLSSRSPGTLLDRRFHLPVAPAVFLRDTKAISEILVAMPIAAPGNLPRAPDELQPDASSAGPSPLAASASRSSSPSSSTASLSGGQPPSRKRASPGADLDIFSDVSDLADYVAYYLDEKSPSVTAEPLSPPASPPHAVDIEGLQHATPPDVVPRVKVLSLHHQALEDSLRLLQWPTTQFAIIGLVLALMAKRGFATHPTFLVSLAGFGLFILAHLIPWALGRRSSRPYTYAAHTICLAILLVALSFLCVTIVRPPEQLASGPVINGNRVMRLLMHISMGLVLGGQQHLTEAKKFLAGSVFMGLRLLTVCTFLARTLEPRVLLTLLDADLPFVMALLVIMQPLSTTPPSTTPNKLHERLPLSRRAVRHIH